MLFSLHPLVNEAFSRVDELLVPNDARALHLSSCSLGAVHDTPKLVLKSEGPTPLFSHSVGSRFLRLSNIGFEGKPNLRYFSSPHFMGDGQDAVAKLPVCMQSDCIVLLVASVTVDHHIRFSNRT